MQWQSQEMPCSTWSLQRGPAHRAGKGQPPWHLHTLEIPTQTLAREKSTTTPGMGLAQQLVWGSCGAVGWLLPFPATADGTVSSPAESSAGKWGDPQVLPWKAKSCQQQAGAGLGWRPCAQTVMDSRRPMGTQGSPQRSFSSWAAGGSGPKATSVRKRYWDREKDEEQEEEEGDGFIPLAATVTFQG